MLDQSCSTAAYITFIYELLKILILLLTLTCSVTIVVALEIHGLDPEWKTTITLSGHWYPLPVFRNIDRFLQKHHKL